MTLDEIVAMLQAMMQEALDEYWRKYQPFRVTDEILADLGFPGGSMITEQEVDFRAGTVKLRVVLPPQMIRINIVGEPLADTASEPLRPSCDVDKPQ